MNGGSCRRVDGLDVMGPMYMETKGELGKWVAYSGSPLGTGKMSR